MSNVSNIHAFTPYISAGADHSKALSEQRLLVVRYRKSKTGVEKQSVCASVPVVAAADVQTSLQVLMPHVLDWVRSVQDEIGRSVYESGASHVTTEQIDIVHCVAFLQEQAAGERLTADVIRDWFAAEMQDVLLLAFAEKMQVPDRPTDEQSRKLDQIVNVYRDKLASLAGGRTMFDAATRAKLLRALELVDCSEGIGAKLQAKLKAMSNVSVEDMLGL